MNKFPSSFQLDRVNKIALTVGVLKGLAGAGCVAVGVFGLVARTGASSLFGSVAALSSGAMLLAQSVEDLSKAIETPEVFIDTLSTTTTTENSNET